MPTSDLEKWKNRQIQAAIERGVYPIDAARAMDDFIAALPQGADPATYILPGYALEQNLTSDAIIQDARNAWYGDVDPRYARLLDAGLEDE